MRRTPETRPALHVSLAACALLTVAAQTRAAEPELDKKAPLTALKDISTHLRAYPLGRHKAVAKPSMKRLQLGAKSGDAILLVDVNGNGRFGDLGVDGWTRPGKAYRYLVPIERWIVLRDRQIWLRFDEDGAGVHFRAERFEPREGSGEDASDAKASKPPRGKAEVAGLLAWNDVRLRNGLVPVRLSRKLSDGCRQHALYCAANGITHVQVPSRSHASAAGADAAKWSGIGSAEPAAEVDLAYRALYHRIQLIHPTTTAAGIGAAHGVTVLDGSRARGMEKGAGRTRRKWVYPVVIPAPGSVGQPRAFSSERPRPHPGYYSSDRALKAAGLPVTVTFLRPAVKDISAELRLGGPKGVPVKFLLSSPEEPANAAIPDNYKTIALLPRAALSAGKTYWVRIIYTRTDVKTATPTELTWTFETGK